MISFIVRTTPVAQPRQRHRIVTPRRGKDFVQNYTPGDHPVGAFKDEVRLAARSVHQGEPPLAGPLFVRMVFVMKRPQRLTVKEHGAGRVWYDVKPDSDNLFKSAADALNGHIWIDDAQIVRALVTKFYAAIDESPHVVIEVERAV